MTAEEFELLTIRAQPHDKFKLDWSSYYSLEYADTFLPKVEGYKGKAIRMYDGGELFKGLRKREKEVFAFVGSDELIRLISYSYPKSVLAQERKNSVQVTKHEVITFIEIDQDDSIDISFKFGDRFKEQLKIAFKDKKTSISPTDVEAKSYKTDITTFTNFFNKELVHATMMEYILKTIGVYETVTLDKKNIEELKEIFLEIEDDFGAGFVKEKHPEAFGHGDIELEALTKAGYTPDEIDQVYFGNWLRDFSQVIVASTVGFNEKDYNVLLTKYSDRKNVQELSSQMRSKPSQNTWVEILRLLAIKEFTFNVKKKKGQITTQDYKAYENEFKRKFGTLTSDILGIYRPEEHLDNPKKLEDESIFGDEDLEYPIVFNYEFEKGKFTPQKLYAGEVSKSLKIDEIANMKRFLKEDIDPARPSSFTYFKQQLSLAKQKGKNKDGLRHFGAALHVLEDYFAHSNFIEIALIKNGHTKVFPWVQLSPEIEKIKKGIEKASKIPVVTGLFAIDDTVASITPKLAEEFFPIGFEEYNRLKPGERTFFDALIITLLEDLAIKQSTVPNDEKVKYVGLTIQDILEAYKRFLSFRDAWARKEELPIVGILFRSISLVAHYFGQSIQFYNNVLFNIILNSVEDGIREEQTRNRQDFGTDPTHTQIAKDPVDHPLNQLAGVLAVQAVTDIGKKMRLCWSGAYSIDKLVEYSEKTYFAHPNDVTWMDAKVKSWARRNRKAVRLAESKTAIHHLEEVTKKNLEKFKDEIENIQTPPSNK